MVMTLDGATVGHDGLSGSISGAADKRVFMETRRLADVVLVGAGTIRAERYRPMVAKPEWQDARVDAGLAPAVQVVIVSGRLDLPWDEPLFSDSTLPVIVVTSESADARQLAVANDHAQVWQIGATSVDLRAMVSALHKRGLRPDIWQTRERKPGCPGRTICLDFHLRTSSWRTISPFVYSCAKASPRTFPDSCP